MKEPTNRGQKDNSGPPLSRYCLYDGDTYCGCFTAQEIADRIGCAINTVWAVANSTRRYRRRWYIDRLAEDEMLHETDRILALAEAWDRERKKILGIAKKCSERM